ncbi:GntT/GntP/DsdX family permease [Streptomyces albus]
MRETRGESVVHPALALVLGAVRLGIACGLDPAHTLEVVNRGFGDLMAKAGLLIVLGVLLGTQLSALGAIDKLMTLLLRRLGPKLLPYSFAVLMGTVLQFIFTDVLLMVTAPLARTLGARIGRYGVRHHRGQRRPGPPGPAGTRVGAGRRTAHRHRLGDHRGHHRRRCAGPGGARTGRAAGAGGPGGGRRLAVRHPRHQQHLLAAPEPAGPDPQRALKTVTVTVSAASLIALGLIHVLSLVV